MMMQKELIEKLMSKKTTVILVGLLLVVSANSNAQRMEGNQEQFQVLLFTKSLDFHHLSISNGVQMFKELSQNNHFGLTWTEQSDFFDENHVVGQGSRTGDAEEKGG
jgi:hypothetical protein